MLLRVLGPLEVEIDTGGPVDLGGPRQRAVLALLLAARGEVVSVGQMIEDLWRGDAPPRAIASSRRTSRICAAFWSRPASAGHRPGS